MDFQGFVNTFAMPCCILSVKKSSSGHCEEIRILKANDLYKETMGVARYHDGMIYSELVPKDLKYEDFCYRAAILKQKMHAYVETRGLNCWTDQTLIPLHSDNEKIGYCAFFFEFTRTAQPKRMSNVSMDTAEFVIKNSIELRANEDFQAGMNSIISEIQAKTDSFSSCIFLIDYLRQEYSVLCEKFHNNVAKIADYADRLPYKIVASWENTIGKSNCIFVKDEIDMKNLEARNPEWVASLRNSDVKSLILFPLVQNRKVIGFLFITNFDTKRSVEIKELLELTAFFLSAEISSHLLLTKLEHLSNTDLLTGVKNRNSMNNRVDLFVNGEELVEAPFGVVFADVNGLKQMNDKNGHEAGDTLIKSAARIIKEVFNDGEVYRAGGDEFVIIVPGCGEKEFEQKVEALKSRTGFGSEVCLAVGSHWDMYGENLRRAMHLADEEMYKDKEKFYHSHENIVRRS